MKADAQLCIRSLHCEAMNVFRCRSCSKVFRGSSSRVARSQRDRHERETHGSKARIRLAIQQRKRADRERQQRIRREKFAVRVEPNVRWCIICPMRREISHGMFSKAKRNLVIAGAAAKSINRLQGSMNHF